MGVDIRWFSHDLREYIDTGARWGFTGHPSACVLYTLMRGRWNGGRIEAFPDNEDQFFDFASEYRNVTAEAEAELRRVGCWCVPGQTPDDPAPAPDGRGKKEE